MSAKPEPPPQKNTKCFAEERAGDMVVLCTRRDLKQPMYGLAWTGALRLGAL